MMPGSAEAEHFGVKRINEALTRDNFRRILAPLIGRGDFLLNVSVDVSSIALIRFCWEKGAMYLDTCIEPWAGGYTDPTLSAARRTNYALREEALALRAGNAARTDRGGHAWRQPGHGLAPGQAGHAEHRRATPASMPAIRPRAMTGRRWPTCWASASSISRSAIPRCPRGPSSWTSS